MPHFNYLVNKQYFFPSWSAMYLRLIGLVYLLSAFKGKADRTRAISLQVALIRVLYEGGLCVLSYECVLNQITDAVLFSRLK